MERKNFGKKFSQFMKQTGKSQKQVSKETGLSTSVISQFLDGKYTGDNREGAGYFKQVFKHQ